MDFALDTVSFDLGTGATRDAAPATDVPAHDEHWYDVQTKFDLAKAYQEMGDKDGAREILAEVIKDGDAQQQAEAKELLDKLA
jgi:pilus assembly protein FimV